MVVVMSRMDGSVNLDGLVDTDSVPVGRSHTRNLDGSLVYLDGLLEDRTADRTVDGSLVNVNGLLEDRAANRGVNDGFVDMDGLLVGRRPGVVVVTVVVVIVAVTILDNGFGQANVFAVTGLIASTVFTLDLVNGSVVLFRDHRLRTVVMVMVMSVGVDFNTSVRIRRASGSVGVIMLALIFCLGLKQEPAWLITTKYRAPTPGSRSSEQPDAQAPRSTTK